MILRLDVLVQCRIVTDGRTDGLTKPAYTTLTYRRAIKVIVLSIPHKCCHLVTTYRHTDK